MSVHGSEKLIIQKYAEGNIQQAEDWIVQESPLEIRLKYIKENGWHRKSIAVTMRTPVNDEDLAMGFLFTEGIIRSADDITDIKIPAENILEIGLHENVHLDENRFQRNFYVSSSCGVCGKASIESVQTENVWLPWSSDIKIKATDILLLNEALFKEQNLFGITGGIHATGFFNRSLELVIIREDVGRHNAMDKLIGAYMKVNSFPMNGIAMVSGRAGFELVQKASMAGIPVLVAVGAPSSLAVELAQAQGMTLIGFLKRDKFNIYSCPERITL